MQLLISELNGLTTWTADVGNAYLEAETKYKWLFLWNLNLDQNRKVVYCRL